MLVNPDSFFRDMTRHICSSLDINVALERVLDYLRGIFPVNEILFCLTADENGTVKVFSRAMIQRPEQIQVVSLPQEFWQWFRLQTPFRSILFSDETFEMIPPQFVEYFPRRYREAGEIVVHLEVEEEVIGVLMIFAPQGFFYSQEHADLMGSISEPFALALANAVTTKKLHQALTAEAGEGGGETRDLRRSNLIIGERNGLKKVMGLVDQVAGMNNTVLILGETGVGKEVIANAIHQRSPRWSGPFIKVNCGAIPDTLIDSELFGHEKGAFTGAEARQRGRFERADGGTIFLDEIGELSPSAQVRLLRVLSNREIERLGGGKIVPVDIRVIAATHRDLSKLVAEGSFREDLWFRLNVFPIALPPLRERKSDIPAFLRYFISLKCRESDLPPPLIAPGGLNRLLAYDWPGNIRELENIVERELILHQGGDLKFETVGPLLDDPLEMFSGPVEGNPWPSLDEVIKNYIAKVLKKTDDKISGRGGAAEILGVNANTLRSRLYKIGLKRINHTRK